MPLSSRVHNMLLIPLLRRRGFRGGKLMAGSFPVHINMSARPCQKSGQLLALLNRAEPVVAPGADEDRRTRKIRQRHAAPRDHRMMKDRAFERVRNVKHHTCRDIGAVGVADCHDVPAVEPVHFRRLLEKIVQFMRPEEQVGFVEYPFRQPSEKAGHSVLPHIASDAEHCGGRIDPFRQREIDPARQTPARSASVCHRQCDGQILS